MKTLIKSQDLQRQLADAIQGGGHLILTADTGSGKSVVTAGLLAQAGRRAIVAQPRIANVMSVYGIARKLFGGDLGWQTAEAGHNEGAKTLVVTDGLAVANESLLDNVDIVVIDEIHEFSNNQVSLLFLAKKKGKQIILLSATIDSKLTALMGYIDAQHLNFSGARSFPTQLHVGASLGQVVAANHNCVLLFGAGKAELEDFRSALQHDHKIPDAQMAILTAETQQEHLSQLLGEEPSSIRYWLATNVAQAGITPAACDAVVISGVKKEMHSVGYADDLRVVNISQEDFTQQAGRTGRVCKGDVYTLLSEYEYENLKASSTPEIQRTRVHDVYLSFLSKGYRLEEVAPEMLFAPSAEGIQTAKEELTAFGCITNQGGITQKGRLASKLPMEIGMALGLTYAHAIGVVKEYIMYSAAKSADNRYTLGDLRNKLVPKRKGLYNRMRDLIWKAYRNNKRMIERQAGQLAVPTVEQYDTADRVGAALMLAAPTHNLTFRGCELSDGKSAIYRLYNDDLCLIDKFAYRGRVHGNVVFSVSSREASDERSLFNLVAQPLIETTETPTSQGFQVVVSRKVKAQNGAVIEDAEIESYVKPYDLYDGEHIRLLTAQCRSMEQIADAIKVDMAVTKYDADRHDALAPSFDAAPFIEMAREAEDIVDLKEVIEVYEAEIKAYLRLETVQALKQKASANGLPTPHVEKDPRTGKAIAYYAIEEIDAEKPLPVDAHNGFYTIEHRWKAYVGGKVFYPASREDYIRRKAQIERQKAQENVEYEAQAFKDSLSYSQGVSLRSSSEEVDFADFIAPYLEPKFKEVGEGECARIIAYRYRFDSYSEYWEKVNLVLTYDNEEVQDFEEDLLRAEAAVVAKQVKIKEYEISEDFDWASLKSEASAEEGVLVIDGIRYGKPAMNLWYSERYHEIIVAPMSEDLSDKAVRIEGDPEAFVNAYIDALDAAQEAVQQCRDLADQCYDERVPSFSIAKWQSKLDKLRNELYQNPSEAIKTAKKYKQQLDKLLADANPNTLGNSIDLSALQNLFK